MSLARKFSSADALATIGPADRMPNGQLGTPLSILPWVAGPFRLVSLLEMLEFNAAAFVSLFSDIASLEARWARLWPSSYRDTRMIDDPAHDDIQKELSDSMRRDVPVLLGDIENKCQAIGLDSAVAQTGRIRRAIKDGQTLSEITKMVKQMRERAEDQLAQRLFLFVPIDRAKHYSEKELFGAEVDSKFPDAAYDITEAGKCLALNRSTAVVCHLMRVVEAGVKMLAAKLSTTIDTDRPWGAILHQIDAEIRSLKNSGKNVDDFEGIAASLHAVKDAWRNPAMHSKAKYTEEEAEEIFNASRTFMRRLAQLI